MNVQTEEHELEMKLTKDHEWKIKMTKDIFVQIEDGEPKDK